MNVKIFFSQCKIQSIEIIARMSDQIPCLTVGLYPYNQVKKGENVEL
jgi:hypothetical protein